MERNHAQGIPPYLAEQICGLKERFYADSADDPGAQNDGGGMQ